MSLIQLVSNFTGVTLRGVNFVCAFAFCSRNGLPVRLLLLMRVRICMRQRLIMSVLAPLFSVPCASVCLLPRALILTLVSILLPLRMRSTASL